MCNWPNYSDREECKVVLDDLSACGHVEEIARVAAIALFCVQGMLCLEVFFRIKIYKTGTSL